MPYGDKVLTNSSTGETAFIIVNPSAAANTAFVGNAAARAALADSLIEVSRALTLGGNVETISIATAANNADITYRAGSSLIVTT
jgi:hypothetical protein